MLFSVLINGLAASTISSKKLLFVQLSPESAAKLNLDSEVAKHSHAISYLDRRSTIISILLRGLLLPSAESPVIEVTGHESP